MVEAREGKPGEEMRGHAGGKGVGESDAGEDFWRLKIENFGARF